jgi:hypothetical protein
MVGVMVVITSLGSTDGVGTPLWWLVDMVGVIVATTSLGSTDGVGTPLWWLVDVVGVIVVISCVAVDTVEDDGAMLGISVCGNEHIIMNIIV